jgi:hypothetical protein
MTMQSQEQDVRRDLNIRPITTVILSTCAVCSDPIHAWDDASTYKNHVAHRDCAEAEVSLELRDLEDFARVCRG